MTYKSKFVTIIFVAFLIAATIVSVHDSSNIFVFFGVIPLSLGAFPVIYDDKG